MVANAEASLFIEKVSFLIKQKHKLSQEILAIYSFGSYYESNANIG
jgi:hypothetical protein